MGALPRLKGGKGEPLTALLSTVRSGAIRPPVRPVSALPKERTKRSGRRDPSPVCEVYKSNRSNAKRWLCIGVRGRVKFSEVEVPLYGVLRSSRRPAIFRAPLVHSTTRAEGALAVVGNGLHAPWGKDLCGLLPGRRGGPRGSKGLLLLLAVVVAHLGVPPQEPAEGPLLLRSPWSGPAEDADLPRVGVDHHVGFHHRGEAQVP